MGGLQIPMEHVLVLAGLLFSCGLLGLMLRRNIIFMLMSLEVMLNASALAFVAAGARWDQADGQIIFLLILSVAAAEAGEHQAAAVRHPVGFEVGRGDIGDLTQRHLI